MKENYKYIKLLRSHMGYKINFIVLIRLYLSIIKIDGMKKFIRSFTDDNPEDILDRINLNNKYNRSSLMYLNSINYLSNSGLQPQALGVFYNPRTTWKERFEIVKMGKA